jgi:hypothetical protein
LTVIQDFSVNSATSSQTVTAGQTSGAYQLTVAPNPPGSSFPGAVTLSCPSGLPTGAQCAFSPSGAISLASGSQSVVMNISTAAKTGSLSWPARGPSNFNALWLMLPGIVIAWGGSGRKRRRLQIACIGTVLILMALTLVSCGGGAGSSGGGGTHAGSPLIYTVTVTGTSTVTGISGTISHNTSVTLVVQ